MKHINGYSAMSLGPSFFRIKTEKKEKRTPLF